MSSPRPNFYRLVTDAINDLMRNGYDQKRLDMWLEKLSVAAEQSLTPIHVLEKAVQDRLLKVFNRSASTRQLLRVHKGISEFKLASIKPKLHTLLEQRIQASVGLIKLNREKAVTDALSRLAGWATSVPPGGTDVGKRVKVRKNVRRGIAGLPYTERRVIVDQGHKLVASINEIVAVDGGAIAGRWHHVEEGPPAYDSRPLHVARDNVIYIVRGNWAMARGLMKLAGHLYTDEITAPGEEISCRCWYTYLYNLRDLPEDMLTEKGEAELERVRAQIASWRAAA